jgi:hypothetical protein
LKFKKIIFIGEQMKNTTLKKSKSSINFFEYKGKPLVRCGNVIYFGDINNRYVVKIESKAIRKVSDLNVSTRLSVEMIDTEPASTSDKTIVKISEKNGLYLALDIADAWLDRPMVNKQ